MNSVFNGCTGRAVASCEGAGQACGLRTIESRNCERESLFLGNHRRPIQVGRRVLKAITSTHTSLGRLKVQNKKTLPYLGTFYGWQQLIPDLNGYGLYVTDSSSWPQPPPHQLDTTSPVSAHSALPPHTAAGDQSHRKLSPDLSRTRRPYLSRGKNHLPQREVPNLKRLIINLIPYGSKFGSRQGGTSRTVFKAKHREPYLAAAWQDSVFHMPGTSIPQPHPY